MKYKVGDKVRYDGGDWWFFGTVSAVFEHSICPCYRLSVERMEKKSCKFSITQFEFELEAYHEVVKDLKDKRKWEDEEVELLKKYHGVLEIEDLSKMLKKSQQSVEDKLRLIKSEPEKAQEQTPEPEKKTRKRRKQIQDAEQIQDVNTEKVKGTKKLGKDGRKSKISDAWYKNLELYQKGEKNSSIYNWMSINRKLYQSGELPDDKLEKLTEISFPFVSGRNKTGKVELTQKPKKEAPKRKRGEAWDINFELYRNGEKSNAISTWMALNRKEFKTGTLTERKLDKLMEINFPFETTKKKRVVTGTND